MRVSPLLVLSAAALVTLVACDDTPPEPELDTTVMVGPLELAISSRNDGHDPAGALHIEVNGELVRMEGVHITELGRGGRLPEAETGPQGYATLRDAIRAAPSRAILALTLHGVVPYGTTVRVVQAALEAGYRTISFAVRPPNAATPSTTGWLELTAPRVVGAEEEVTFMPARRWEDFSSHWQEVYEGCRAAAPNYVDCSGPPALAAPGGDLQMVLFTRGNGMNVRFNQVNAPEAAPTGGGGGPALLEGLARVDPHAGEEEPPTPVTTGAFSFRFIEASLADNHISVMARPVCGSAACPLIIEADEETETMRVLSLLGSVSPNGATSPNVVFRLPD